MPDNYGLPPNAVDSMSARLDKLLQQIPSSKPQDKRAANMLALLIQAMLTLMSCSPSATQQINW